jgi:hypothetical protein
MPRWLERAKDEETQEMPGGDVEEAMPSPEETQEMPGARLPEADQIKAVHQEISSVIEKLVGNADTVSKEVYNPTVEPGDYYVMTYKGNKNASIFVPILATIPILSELGHGVDEKAYAQTQKPDPDDPFPERALEVQIQPKDWDTLQKDIGTLGLKITGRSRGQKFDFAEIPATAWEKEEKVNGVQTQIIVRLKLGTFKIHIVSQLGGGVMEYVVDPGDLVDMEDLIDTDSLLEGMTLGK